MAINFTDFSRAPLNTQESPLSTVFEDALKGYKMQQEPAKMGQEKQQRALANSLQKLALEHKPTEYSLADSLKRAQINKANRPAAAGGGSNIKANGILANYIVSHPGASQEEIKNFADRLLESQVFHTEEGTKLTDILNETQYTRGLSPVTKKHDEIRQINQGYFPGTKVKLNDQQQTSMRNDLLLSLTKDVTDPKTREKLINATNMNITLDSINPTALTQYSGGEGKVDKIADSILESAGFD